MLRGLREVHPSGALQPSPTAWSERPNVDAVRSPLGQLAYIGLLIPLSLLVFRLFEAPAQNALRAGWATLSSAPALRGFGVVRERDRPG